MEVTIYLNFGLLGDENQIDVTLVWDSGNTSPLEDGKIVEPEYPGGYIIQNVTWVSEFGSFNMNGTMSKDDAFAEAVRDALNEEGYEV